MTLPFAFAHRYPQHIILALALLIAMLSRWVGEGAIAAILPLTLWLGWLSVRFPQWGGVMLLPLVIATGFIENLTEI